jgi:hypothetical protein
MHTYEIEVTRSGLVFTTELGGPVDPRNLLRVIEAAARTAGGCSIGSAPVIHAGPSSALWVTGRSSMPLFPQCRSGAWREPKGCRR